MFISIISCEMCYQLYSFVTTNNFNYPENTQNNPEQRQMKYVFQNNRRSTDKYWTGLFVVISIVWIKSWHYREKRNLYEKSSMILLSTNYSTILLSLLIVIHHRKDYKTNLDISPTLQILPVLPYNASFYGIVLYNSTITNATSDFVLFHWVFETITCNITFLDAVHDKGGSILIYANVLFCICLIAYTFASMRSDSIFCLQIDYFGKIFTLLLLHYRVFMFFLKDFTILKMLAIHYDYKIACWVIPEIILTMIRATKKSPKEHSGSHDGEENMKISFRKFMRYVSEIALTFVLILKILIIVTTINVYNSGLNNLLFYAIVGGSCYVGLTFYYLGLMIISCATSIALNSSGSIQKINLFLKAGYVIGRYHYGTACYHATLVFPRLHAVLVMNEVEFKKTPNFSAINRLYITHWRLHNISPIVTAALGENYSTSMRELLRLFTSDSSTVKHFQGFAKVHTSFLAIIIGANSLVLTLLWAQGAIIDLSFPMGTWTMIFITMFLTHLYMKADDAVLDTIWFYTEDENVVKF